MDLFLWIFRLYFLLLCHSILISCLGNDTDKLSLLAFKEGISQDPQQVVSSWNDSTHFCKWVGVSCSLRHHQRVVGLYLGDHKLVGIISPSVGNLSFLRKIDLSSNYFSGNIPQEFGHLSRLQQLNLSINSLGGNFSSLRMLSLGRNTLQGSIPNELEYGVGGEVSTAGDMYSYGILLLEMFTGKKPTDEMFKDGLSLYEFVASTLPDRALEIVDVSLFSEPLEEGEDENGEFGNVNESEEAPALSSRTTEWKNGECLVSILSIALSCCAPSPKDRAVASDVIKKMSSIRDLFMCTP